MTALLLSGAVGIGSATLWVPSGSDLFLKKPFVSLERVGFSGLFALRGSKPERIDDRIVVVGFTRESEQNLGRRWPLPRRYHAQLIDKLSADGALLIVVDALFSGPTNEKDDRALDQALKRAGNVVIAGRIDRDPIQKRRSLDFPYYDDSLGIDFESAAMVGLAEVQVDDDDVVRGFVPAMKFMDEWIPSLAGAAYLRLHGRESSDVSYRDGYITLGGTKIGPTRLLSMDPFDGSPIPSFLVDFASGRDAFDSQYTIDRVIAGQAPKGYFKGKIVCVGVSGFEQARELNDIYTISSTHLDTESESASTKAAQYGRIPGVYVQAHFLNSLLKGGFIRESSPLLLGIAMFVLTLIGTWLTRRFLNWRGPVTIVAIMVGYVVVSVWAFDSAQLHIPYIVPMLLFTTAVGVSSWLERGTLKKRWSGYVAPDVLEHILREEDGVLAKRHEATVMFGDIRGFTAFSDRHDPEEVVKLLNLHFERLTAEVYKYGGTIDKFMGDGILVVFGAPVHLPDAAIKAVHAALAMRDLSLQPLPGTNHTFATGFGIATGPLVAGHVGSRKRHDYTVIGDVVNLASRLQGVTGEPDVIVEAATRELLGDAFEFEYLGAVELKGKSKAVEAYKVLRSVKS